MSNFMGAALTVDDIYPVGSIYMSVNATEPAKLFGGTWERIKERFLLGAGDTHTAGSTGGEFEVKLTTEELPSHNHPEKKLMSNGIQGYIIDPNTYGTYDGDIFGVNQLEWYKNKSAILTESTGGDMPHSNTPPYLAVYIWKRTA